MYLKLALDSHFPACFLANQNKMTDSHTFPHFIYYTLKKYANFAIQPTVDFIFEEVAVIYWMAEIHK